jgi:chromosome segregation ATPase
MTDVSQSDEPKAGSGSQSVAALGHNSNSAGEHLQALEAEIINLRTRMETLEQDMEKERSSRMECEDRIEQLLLSSRVAQQKRDEQDQAMADESMQRTEFFNKKNRSVNERVAYLESKTDGLRDETGW